MNEKWVPPSSGNEGTGDICNLESGRQGSLEDTFINQVREVGEEEDSRFFSVAGYEEAADFDQARVFLQGEDRGHDSVAHCSIGERIRTGKGPTHYSAYTRAQSV